MKKRAVYGLLMAVLVLAGCDGGQQNASVPSETPVAPQSQGTDAVTSALMREDETQKSELESTAEGELGYASVSLYMGQGYSIYIPDSGWKLERDVDDGISEDHWENILRDDVELTVSRYAGMTAETARTAFVADEEDYRFEASLGGEWGNPLTGTEPNGDVLSFMLQEDTDAVYIVSWRYPAGDAENFSSQLRQIADTFEIVN